MAITAHTRRLGRLISLCGNAIELARHNKRESDQVEILISALQEFKDAKAYHPGRFGNRCAGCGGYIDEGDFCPCGHDHS